MLYDVTTLTVRVVPRSSRAAAERDRGELVLRVRAPAEGGRATEEARRLLAESLGVPRSAVTLRRGVRSRTKIFQVEGLAPAEIAARVEAIPPRSAR
jgi:uncharacterized protein